MGYKTLTFDLSKVDQNSRLPSQAENTQAADHLFIHISPITLQAVGPMVTCVPQQWSHLPGCPIFIQVAPVLQLPFQIHMRPCVTVTALYTPWTTPSVTVTRNSSVHARNCLYMLTVPNSEAEILNILKLP